MRGAESGRKEEWGCRMGYLGEGEGVGHGADEDLTQLPVEVGALDPVQVGIHPEDPGEREVRSRSRSYHLFSSDLISTDLT